MTAEESALAAWIRTHDDRWTFIVLYIGAAVVLSIWISLFWLVFVVACHFAIEYVRQQRTLSPAAAVVESLWEIKLDVALVMMALALSLYMEVVMGIVGLQAASRGAAVSRVGARFAGWQRALRGVLLSVDDAAQVARMTAARGRRGGGGTASGPASGAEADAESAGDSRSVWGSWAEPWSRGSWFTCGLGLACVVLVVAAPWLTLHDFQSAIETILTELRPFP